jgi:hypothetical protein
MWRYSAEKNLLIKSSENPIHISAVVQQVVLNPTVPLIDLSRV